MREDHPVQHVAAMRRQADERTSQVALVRVAPDETGSGVLWASAGRHFLGSSAFAPNVPQGEPLEGVETAAIASTSVAIRHPSGAMRGADEIDAEICDRTMTALAQGRSVLVHLLETSKTGQSGLSLPMARHLASAGAGRVLVVADCCQLRAGADAVRDFLALDFPVILTGSKFMGGPAFAGAVLVPPALRARLATLVLPQGLADYSARLDWPARCQAHVGQTLAADANPGLGLRWVAALAEMERYASIAAPMRDAILERFARETVGRAAAVPGLRHLAEPRPFSPLPASIHCFSMHRPSGSALTPAKTAAIHVALRTAAAAEGPLARRIHLGQPVALGATSFGALSALRVCAGAPMVSAVAERMDSGDDLETAFEPVAGDLAVLFAKWTRILASYG